MKPVPPNGEASGAGPLESVVAPAGALVLDDAVELGISCKAEVNVISPRGNPT